MLPYVGGISGLEFENPLALRKQYRQAYGLASWKARHTRTGHLYADEDMQGISKFFDLWAWHNQGKFRSGNDYTKRLGSRRNAQVPWAAVETDYGKAAAVLAKAEKSELVILIERQSGGLKVFTELAGKIRYADDIFFGDIHRVNRAFSNDKLHDSPANVKIAGSAPLSRWYNLGVNPFTTRLGS